VIGGNLSEAPDRHKEWNFKYGVILEFQSTSVSTRFAVRNIRCDAALFAVRDRI